MNYLFFIYGMVAMFYGLMSWIFWRKGPEMLYRLVTILMIVSLAQCVKDLFFVVNEAYWQPGMWRIMTAVDMVIIPIYGFILKELVTPGKLTWRNIIIHELPFIALPIGLLLTGIDLLFYINIGWAAIYGILFVVWTLIQIPKYNQQLKDKYSYSENVNLRWLRIILYSFFGILSLWIVDCFAVNVEAEGLYLLGSLATWMAISYFIYRHESVLEEFTEDTHQGTEQDVEMTDTSCLAVKIEQFICKEKAFLNPRLRLSDVAQAVASNRSYVSNYFNKDLGVTFFDYVNNLRIEYACGLLTGNMESIEMVALKSGFNSVATFYRVFSQKKGCTPANYRGGGKTLIHSWLQNTQDIQHWIQFTTQYNYLIV